MIYSVNLSLFKYLKNGIIKCFCAFQVMTHWLFNHQPGLLGLQSGALQCLTGIGEERW